eukprot:5210454-Pleurochrysis_carterae.AAC.1
MRARRPRLRADQSRRDWLGEVDAEGLDQVEDARVAEAVVALRFDTKSGGDSRERGGGVGKCLRDARGRMGLSHYTAFASDGVGVEPHVRARGGHV